MTNKEHELLVIGLCGYLNYSLICETNDGKGTLVSVEPISDLAYVQFNPNVDAEEYEIWYGTVKPYLRPMDSMTDEESKEFDETLQYTQRTLESYDWLNKHHFDYRGLIGKGLAIEAPEGMYNI